jgi:transglutaminase-like putative cysteine protease
MNGLPAPRPAARLAAFALFACGALAVLNLPRPMVPTGWLLAWLGPAMLFGALPRRSRRPWLRAVLATAVQVLAFAGALWQLGPLARPAILACTILPPLAFVAVRRRDADAALGLFLSFCVLLVGVTLGGPDPGLLAAYGICACLALRGETHLAALAQCRRPDWRVVRRTVAQPVLLTAIAIALPCLFAAVAVERALSWLPSPLRSHAVAAPPRTERPPRRQGLDDSFQLAGGGLLADLAGEELVLVRTDDASPMPTDLYLRSGFFSRAHFDRWEPPRLLLRHVPDRRDHGLRRATPGHPIRRLEVERFAGARNFVFVPPDAVWIGELPDLQIDLERMWLRQDPDGDQTDYVVAYQQLPGPGDGDRVDETCNTELLALPAGFGGDDRRRFRQLLDGWDATGSPWRIAARIAAGLAGHCRYDRAEPSGPFARTIDNFLFAPRDRHGFCMHFASAAALLLRLRGVPCRIGVGLYGGSRDRVDPEARSYGSQHAHAWVEIPVAGRGWVVFDPTPPAERGQPLPSRLAGGDRDAALPAAPAPAPAGGLLDLLRQPWLLFAILLLVVAVAMWPARRTPEPTILLPRPLRTARRLLVRILGALAEAGQLRRRGDTLEQFLEVLAVHQRLDPAVATALRTYQEVRFGGRAFDRQREQQLLRGLEAARRAPAVNAASTPVAAGG